MIEAPFCGLPFLTEPGKVMTPRPTTEALVETAAARIGDRPALVADVGPGCGAGAIALAQLRAERPQLAGEPPEAIFAEGDGLGPYRRLVEACRRALRPEGFLAIQLHGRVVTSTAAELAALTLAA